MECPECQSTHVSKNGHKRGKQNYRCVDCGRQFVDNPKPHRGYSDEVRRVCLKMSVNGMGFRGIERVTAYLHGFGRMMSTSAPPLCKARSGSTETGNKSIIYC